MQALNGWQLLVEFLGWSGMVLILGAYLMVSIGRLKPDSRTYQWMNIVGSVSFVVNTLWLRAYPSAVLNIIWAMIGVYSVIKRARAVASL